MYKLYYLNLIVILFLSLLVTTADSQLNESFDKGKIVLKNGEQLNGFIKDEETPKLMFSVYFKSQASEKMYSLYDTAQLKSFTLNSGEIYELKHIYVNNNEDSITCFAKLLLRGKATLYKFYYKTEEMFVVDTRNKLFVLQDDKLDNTALEAELKHFFYLNNLTAAIQNFSSATANLDKISYHEKDFINIIAEYNTTEGSKNEYFNFKAKPLNFIIASIGYNYTNSLNNEIGIQLMHRTYFPKLSRSTSLNIGLNYFKQNYSTTYKDIYTNFVVPYTYHLFSIPVQLQENLLNGGIRHYLFLGANLSYVKRLNEKGQEDLPPGLNNKLGFAFLFGGGAEADLYKGLMFKLEFRFENYAHMALMGLAYNFSKK